MLIFECYQSGIQLGNRNGKLFYSGDRSAVNGMLNRLAENKHQILDLLTTMEDKLYRLVQVNDFDAADLADVYLMWKLAPDAMEEMVSSRLYKLQMA